MDAREVPQRGWKDLGLKLRADTVHKGGHQLPPHKTELFTFLG